MTTTPKTRFPRALGIVAPGANSLWANSLWARVAVVVWLSLAAAAVRGETDDARFLAGLRQRRLFKLAEVHCRYELNRQDLTAAQRGDLVVELIRTFAEHAVNTSTNERQPLWQSAQEAAESFQRTEPGNPRLLLVRTQRATTLLARGALARQEAEVGGDREQSLNTARLTIRESIRQLQQLEEELKAEIPLRRRARLEEGDLTADELFALQNNIRLQLARAYRNQALSYPAGDVNRIAALTEAVQTLQRPLKELPAADPLTWRVLMDQVVCLRLSGEYGRVRQLLTPLSGADAPPEIRQQAFAEAARLLLAGKRADQAWQLLEKAGQGLADLDYARLETLIALWKAAGEEPGSKAWREQAVELVNQIEQQHGPYWGRRSSQLLVAAAGSSSGGGNLEILRRTAETLYRKSQFDEARQAYEKAATQAEAAGAVERSFEFAFLAARIQQRQGETRDYLERLRRLSLSMHSYPKSAAAHQLAISACIALARRDHSLLPLYEELLAEHLQQWPRSETANQARIWFARVRSTRKQWSEAIELLGAAPADSPSFEPAVRAAAETWRSLLDQQRSVGDVDPQVADAAASFFETRLLGPQNRWPAAWSDLDRFLAVTAAAIRLKYRNSDHALAERLLEAALQGSPDAAPDWTREVQSLLVAALAGQPERRGVAQQLLASIGVASAPQLLDLLDSLARLTAEASAPVRPQLAELQLRAADLLEPKSSQLQPAQRRRLRILRGEALAALDRGPEALAIFQELAKEFPRDGPIQQALAEQLSAQPGTLPQALVQWRIVARGSKPRSPRWYRAKYEVALAQYRIGGDANKRAAADLINYLQATSGLDATPLKAKFLDLLKRCQ